MRVTGVEIDVGRWVRGQHPDGVLQQVNAGRLVGGRKAIHARQGIGLEDHHGLAGAESRRERSRGLWPGHIKRDDFGD
jgi:hypothetical protein